jgi:hypothetical protein
MLVWHSGGGPAVLDARGLAVSQAERGSGTGSKRPPQSGNLTFFRPGRFVSSPDTKNGAGHEPTPRKVQVRGPAPRLSKGERCHRLTSRTIGPRADGTATDGHRAAAGGAVASRATSSRRRDSSGPSRRQRRSPLWLGSSIIWSRSSGCPNRPTGWGGLHLGSSHPSARSGRGNAGRPHGRALGTQGNARKPIVLRATAFPSLGGGHRPFQALVPHSVPQTPDLTGVPHEIPAI